MAETTPTWISCQDPTCYTPQEMRLADGRFVCEQGIAMREGGELAVTQNVGDPLCVDIASGGAWINADLGGDCQGVYGVHNCGITTLCADDGDPTDPRIDRIVFQVNDSSLGGTQCDSELEIVTGAPSPAPVPPAEPANSITLALITVTSAGITVIADQRRPFVACGATRQPERVLYQVSPGSGTFVKSNYPDASYFEVLMVGGGGGGGGAPAAGAGNAAVAGGGSGAAGAKIQVSYATMPGSVPWSVGNGGSGGGASSPTAGNPGADGQRTTFGDWEMGAGRGGTGSGAPAATPDAVGVQVGGGIVVGSFGNPPIEQAPGDTSEPGVRLNGTQFYGGTGGDGPFGLGVGGGPRTTANSGLAGTGDGSGGAGAASANSAAFVGGSGASGRLVVTAYY